MPDLLFTARGLEPVGAVCKAGHQEPLLVTDLHFLSKACAWYHRRFGIATPFSDQKSQGFRLNHSHLADQERLPWLLIATCLEYYWMVCLDAEVLRRGWQSVIHRRIRCDLSLFQLGLA